MDHRIVRVTIGESRIKANVWQDPFGPTHCHFLAKEHLGYPDRLPQRCSAADYHAVRILAGQDAVGEFQIAVPKLNDCDFGIQVLGISMPWAWNKYCENRKENNEKYSKYCQRENLAYFKDFLKRMDLPSRLIKEDFHDLLCDS